MNAKNNTATDRQDLKRQIRQLESIAALSGGIAHDYNNLLTAVMGNLSLALEHVESDSKLSDLLEQALAASRVAKILTRRLITFSTLIALAIDAAIMFAVFDEVRARNRSHSPTSASTKSPTLAALPWITLASIACSSSAASTAFFSMMEMLCASFESTDARWRPISPAPTMMMFMKFPPALSSGSGGC